MKCGKKDIFVSRCKLRLDNRIIGLIQNPKKSRIISR